MAFKYLIICFELLFGLYLGVNTYICIFFLNLSINPQLIISSVFLVTFCFGGLKVVVSPTHPSILPWPAVASQEKERPMHPSLAASLLLPLSLTAHLFACVVAPDPPLLHRHCALTHSCLSFCLCPVFSQCLCLSACLPACLPACWSPSQGPPHLGTDCAFSGPVLGSGERSALKIQLGLFTKPHCSYA